MKCSLITFFIYSVLFLLSLFVRTVAFLSWIFMILFILKPPKIWWYAALLKSFWQNGIWREVKQIAVDLIWSVFDPTSPCYVFQVAARTETGVRRRTQAMSRSCSKRKSRFSSLWGLDTTSKKKTKAHPTVSQVCEVFHLLPKFPRLITADKLLLPISQASILPDW